MSQSNKVVRYGGWTGPRANEFDEYVLASSYDAVVSQRDTWRERYKASEEENKSLRNALRLALSKEHP